MRILIYRPVLHSATSIIQHREQAQTAVDVAKDTIRVLTHINQTSDLYRTQQVLFNAFLTSALAVLFLAVSHTPAVFAEDVREEFYMALDLVRGFSKGSWVSKRLWKTIRVLKEVGPKLGLQMKESSAVATAVTEPAQIPKKSSASGSNIQDDPDPNRSAAVAMAGLAGVNVDEMNLYNGGVPQQHQWNATNHGASSSPENMVHDLSSLFEAAGGFHGLAGVNGTDSVGGFAADHTGVGDGFGDEGLSNILQELF